MSGLNIARLREIFDSVFDPVSGGLRTSAAANTAVEYGAGVTTATTQRVAIASDNLVAISLPQVQFTEAQLTAANTATASRSMAGYSQFSIAYTVALNGSTSVTVRAEVSNDGSNWLNASIAGADTTLTISGTYGFIFEGSFQFVRLLFVSEAGGTGATINAIVRLSAGLDGGNGLVEVTAITNAVGIEPPSLSLSVNQSYAALSTITNVASSASSVTLLAANNNRQTAIIANASSSILYIVLNASAASTSNFSMALAPALNGVPTVVTLKGSDYSGEIRGVWTTANGFARITEVT
jgi:hypothetical protein